MNTEDDHLGQGRSPELQQSQDKTAEMALIALLVILIISGIVYFFFHH